MLDVLNAAAASGLEKVTIHCLFLNNAWMNLNCHWSANENEGLKLVMTDLRRGRFQLRCESGLEIRGQRMSGVVDVPS